MLELMIWPDEIRTPEFRFLDEKIDVRPQELSMARSLIESMTGDFAPEQYSDDYREALQALIEAKIEGREVVTPEQPAEQTGNVVDLMAALRASVEAAKAGRAGGEAAASSEDGASGSSALPASKRTGTQKAAAKKAPAKKAATKSASATKAPAKKAASTGKSAGKATGGKSAAKKQPARKSA